MIITKNTRDKMIRAIFRVAIKREKKSKNAGINYINGMKDKYRNYYMFTENIDDLIKSFKRWIKKKYNIK